MWKVVLDQKEVAAWGALYAGSVVTVTFKSHVFPTKASPAEKAQGNTLLENTQMVWIFSKVTQVKKSLKKSSSQRTQELA